MFEGIQSDDVANKILAGWRDKILCHPWLAQIDPRLWSSLGTDSEVGKIASTIAMVPVF